MARALITGAASLMAEGIARALASRGWDFVLTDIDTAGAERVAALLPGNAAAEVAEMDVTDRDQVTAVVAKAARDHGRIDALVSCAGGLRGLGIERKPLAEIPPGDWHRIIDTNLKGMMNSVYAVLPVMKEQGGGAIVSIAASRGLRGGSGASHYSAAKAGIILFTQTMVLECADYGVRINTIAPGNADARWKTEAHGTSQTPLGKPTSEHDIGGAVAWLLSEDATHVTGACIDVSGGTTLH
ncbi:MAG: SDR family NAD(P)-dependent oxidoreductase [Alphaproteobacteria bacterium]